MIYSTGEHSYTYKPGCMRIKYVYLRSNTYKVGVYIMFRRVWGGGK